jgi:peptide/nickel transport system permease protein
MGYMLRRFMTLFLTLLLVSVLTFIAFNIVPGDPVRLILGTEATAERVEALRIQLGLDKPFPQRYVDWLGGFIRGNPGNSIKYSVPVGNLIGERLPVTLSLAILSILLIIAASIPLGIYSAKKRYTLIDRVISTVTMINISMPSFFLGVVFIWVFGIILRLFKPGGYVDYRADFAGFLGYLLYPALAIALPNIAVVVKFLRTSVIGQLKSDYVRTAYSKGNRENAVLYRHVLKNALVPVVTLLGMIVAEIFSGSIIVEQVFGLPGIGRLLISSISSRDFPLIETLVIYIAFIVVVVNFLVDVALRLIDPRIRVK